MTWEEAIKMNPGPMFPKSKCKVSLCHATKCFWNRNKACSLAEVMVDDKGQCMQFKET